MLFIQTGGTIDKDYPKTTKGYAFEFGEPATRRILERLNPSFEYQIVTAFQKDSLEITDDDRLNLVNLIKKHSDQKIIITHGTDTMIDTARYLAHRLVNRLIIITGAMRPERFTNSDASINVGIAIGATNILERGVYVAMHGIVKSFDTIQRDLQSGNFY